MLSLRIGRDTIGLSNRINRDSILITKNKQAIIDTAAAIRLKLNDKIEASQFPNLTKYNVKNKIDKNVKKVTFTDVDNKKTDKIEKISKRNKENKKNSVKKALKTNKTRKL
jgi:hypothetical protein